MNPNFFRRCFGVLLVPIFCLIALVGCGGKNKIISIAVTPSMATIAPAATQQFTAMATYDDGKTQDVSASAIWTSGTTSVATISATGLATGVAAGTSGITAKMGTITSPPATLTVSSPATLVSIAVTPAAMSIAVGATQQYTATGTYTSGPTQNITSQVTWMSGTTSVATISTAGLATAIKAGTSNITASLNGINSPAAGAVLTVTPAATLVSIAVTPAADSIAAGTTLQYTATGTYSSGPTQNITSQVTWVSGTPAAATISATGLATGVAVGTSDITASLNAISSPATGAVLTVTAAGVNLVSITIAPLAATIPVGGTADFTATGHFSDSSTQVLTNVTWGSATGATASITSTGVALGLAAGASNITATSGAIVSAPLAVLTVAPAVARAAYVSATGDGYTATYILNPSTASLVPIASGVFQNFPVQLLPEPSGRFAYALTGVGVTTTSLDSVGRTTGLPSQFLLTPNVASNQGVIDPTGQYLYVASSTTTPATTSIQSYLINLTDGSLTQIDLGVHGFNKLYAVITDRQGRFLYAIDDGASLIYAFSIGVGGALTPLATPTYPTGALPLNPAIDPTNTYLYVPNQGDNSITAYTINADGSLTAVAGQPFTAGVGSGPSYVATDVTGKFLYVTNINDNTISALNIGAGGAIGAAVAGSPFSTGAGPFGIAIDPTNTSLAVSNLFGNSISMYTLAPATGVLTAAALPQVESPSGAFYITYGISTKTAAVNPGIVYAANSVSGDISAFTSTAGTGVLTSTGAPITGNTGNSLAAADLSGSVLLTGSSTGVQVGGFTVNQTTGALTALTGSPQSLAAGNTASSVFAAPTDDFAYVLDATTGSVVQYPVNIVAGIGSGAPTVAFSGAKSLAADPQGDFVYVLGNSGTNGILPFTTYGGFFASTPTTLLPGNWTSGAVDASGQFFVAVDSTAKTLETFSITPAGTGSGTDGALTPIAGSVTLTGSGPWVVAFDLKDRVVFVADQTAGTITPYAFNYTGGGTLGAVGTPTTALANGISNLSIETTGNYLYAGQNAAAAPGSKGAVAVYKISAGGALTAVAGSPFPTGTGNPGVTATNVVQ